LAALAGRTHSLSPPGAAAASEAEEEENKKKEREAGKGDVVAAAPGRRMAPVPALVACVELRRSQGWPHFGLTRTDSKFTKGWHQREKKKIPR
jgi:hypothetical protein